MKPSKAQAIGNALTTFFFALASASYFISNERFLGVLFVVCTAVWVHTTLVSVRSYRTLVQIDRNFEAKLKALQQHVASRNDYLN